MESRLTVLLSLLLGAVASTKFVVDYEGQVEVIQRGSTATLGVRIISQDGNLAKVFNGTAGIKLSSSDGKALLICVLDNCRVQHNISVHNRSEELVNLKATGVDSSSDTIRDREVKVIATLQSKLQDVISQNLTITIQDSRRKCSYSLY